MRLLEHWKSQGTRVGVLMNEAGEVSIDGPRAGTIAEQVMNLAGGANQGIHSVVGKTRVAIHFFGICRHSWRNGAVRGEESSGRCRQRK